MKESINENPLEFFREEISKIDDKIIELLLKRFDFSCVIGKFKKENKIPIVSVDTYKSVMKKYRFSLADYGDEIYSLIHDISKKIQEDETYYIQFRKSQRIK